MVAREGHVVAVVLWIDADERVVVDLVATPHRRAFHPVAVCEGTQRRNYE